MHAIVVILLFFQVAATPLAAGGTLVLSEAEPAFPTLPTDAPPKPITDSLELLYVDVLTTSGDYQVRGEVRNTSESPLTGVTLLFALADGLQFDGPTAFDYIPAGGRAPFSISVYGDDLIAALNTSREFAAIGTCGFEGVAPVQEATWAFADVDLDYDASRRAARVSGTVTNTSGMPSEWSAPTLFAFSKDGHFAGDIYPVGDMTQYIDAGGTVTFAMDHGFDMYHSDQPFSSAGSEPTFVLAMAQPTMVSLSCAG
jgi:hypothetical protein